MRRLLLRLGLVALCVGASPASAASASAMPTPPRAELDQRLDAALPLDLPLTDSSGRQAPLGAYFGDGRPVVLVLGYYRCPNLCGLTMHGLLEALAASSLSRRDWRIVVVSIDPQDTPADALARERVYAAYADFLRDGKAADPLDLHLLVGPERSITALSERVGFAYTPTDAPATPRSRAGDGSAAAASRYAHAAGLVVVTPQGRTSRYLPGVRFDPGALRLALVDAASGRIGGPGDRLLLLCAHFAPATGDHAEAVMNATRGIAAVLALALGGWAWRHRRPPTRETSS